ncbi:MAG: hypothetical protein BWZ10_02948 [candidate division BRC1 bacterium ADurb.BinA364]|nr:MAG: hypothetical protein BWZ10_02948 [candidate division BRC1 bacterium ADurb.BinA364]
MNRAARVFDGHSPFAHGFENFLQTIFHESAMLEQK